ncbi:hypothetical protein [Nonomuraea angiospora]|uniref:hypothetical protein n=1 Tax=Nonomuraea angiospora TaxID=46172 RepID=UPI0029B02631|nr:hypothetical protein [Nonomuraea angiospora]MDX3106062.1 hypothetical protein [Nonomuraea angiospora]
MTAEARISRLAARWPVGALIRHHGTHMRGVVVTAADEIAARWHNSGHGHVSLLPYRDRQDLGGLVNVAWEHGDTCWTRIDVLEVVDATGVYHVEEEQYGFAPVYRLAVRDHRLYWSPEESLMDGYRWANRDDQLVADILAAA